MHELNKPSFGGTGPHTEFTHFPRHALKVEIRNYDATFMIKHGTTIRFYFFCKIIMVELKKGHFRAILRA